MDTCAPKIIRLGMVCFCLATWYAGATIVHIIPLWYDQKTKNWDVLVSRNAGTAIWTDFDNTGTGDAISMARSTIRSFTRGRYNEKNAPLSSAIDMIQYDQHFFFVPILQHLDDKAMHKARNRNKSEFTWVPSTVLAGYSQVNDHRKRKSGRITIDPNFRATFRIIWPDVTKKLSESMAPKACVKA